ncbi:MAG TPA: hypothetical protein DHV22_07955 [Xanthomarina gelatinilytica]|uniref:Uncharacterized protein n=1 Tax=Xanthomarina gelatinilytica TaxID=1137281 RepID=A0A3D6BQK7_9FLAO|nr:hypothetical protein [Xanthomarina gelatinilytica]
MSSKTLNYKILDELVDKVCLWMPLENWEQLLTDIIESYTYHLLKDDSFVGNTEAADQIYSLRMLRDFFREAAKLENS